MDSVMQRWHVPFHVIENEWTVSQWVCLMAATIENENEKQRESSGKKTMGLEAFTSRYMK